MKRAIIVIILIVAAMLLLSCAQDETPSPVMAEATSPAGMILLAVPNPTITATNTRVSWKPATFIGLNPYHPASLGNCQATNIRTSGQNWAYFEQNWAQVEPVRGQYYFDDIDAKLNSSSSQRYMIKIIVNNPVTSEQVVPPWAYDYPDTGNDNIYLLPATQKWTVGTYNAIPATTRVVCSPYNLANYSSLTTAQQANFDTYCRYSQRAAGWDAKFRELYGDLMQALANRYDNDLRVAGFIIHSGGDYGEAGLMYGCRDTSDCPSGASVYDMNDPNNTIVRTMAEIYGASTTELTTSCPPDDVDGTFSSIFYESTAYDWSACWGRYYSLAIKQIIDVAKEHWRSTPLVFSMGNGIVTAHIWPDYSGEVDVSNDVLSYALNCYGNYSVYAKQDGWKPSTAYYKLMNRYATGFVYPGLTSNTGKTVTSLEHGGDSNDWKEVWEQTDSLNNAKANKLMFPCTGNAVPILGGIDYNYYSQYFRYNFDTYAKSGVLAYSPPEPVTCLGGALPTVTATPTGPTPTFTQTPTITNTPIPPTVTPTVTSGGPTLTPTPTPTGYYVMLQNGTNGYTGAEDTYIHQYYPTTNYSTATNILQYYDDRARTLIKFDLSDIPTNSTVVTATLGLYVTYTAGCEPSSAYVRRLTQDVDYSAATWNIYDTGLSWDSAGATGADDSVFAYGGWGDVWLLGDYANCSISPYEGQGWCIIDMVDLVQYWLNNPTENYGMIFDGYRNTDRYVQDYMSSMVSSDNASTAYRPYLFVQYAQATATPTATATVTPTSTPIAVSTVWLGRELTINSSFEGVTGNDFSDWVEANDGGGTVADETTSVRWGTHAVKITSGGAPAASIYRSQSGVSAGQTYRLTFWTRGDGTYAPRYAVYDQTNAAYIIGITSTGVTGTTWTPIATSFTIPAGCTQFRVFLYTATTAGAKSYFDDVSLIRTDAHTYSASVGEVITYTSYITSSTIVTNVLMVDRMMTSVATPVAATPAATWQPSLNRWYWPGLTISPTLQGFTAIWMIPPDQAPGSQTYRNLARASTNSEANVVAQSTHDAVAVVSTYTPTSTSTRTPTVTPTVTNTATNTPTVTPTAIPNFYISEVMVFPTAENCDWNGDGECDSDDQWIEIYQPNPTPQSFAQYKVAIEATDGFVYTYTIPTGTIVNRYIILWPSIQWGKYLSPTGVITISTWANVAQHGMVMPGATPDQSYQFRPEGYAIVTPVWWKWPSFGLPNLTPTPTTTSTVTPTRTITPTKTPTSTPGG